MTFERRGPLSFRALLAECPHGSFGRYFSDHAQPVDGALPFTRNWAFRIMRIAGNEAVANGEHAQHLPPDLETVFQLSLMTAPALEQAIEEGKVTPETTRAVADSCTARSAARRSSSVAQRSSSAAAARSTARPSRPQMRARRR